MTPAIQQKIDDLIKRSKVNRTECRNNDINKRITNDSLLKVIRNKKEADLFLAELDAAFKLAKSV
jgi:hypothetical protein